jgi:hypothetical protein
MNPWKISTFVFAALFAVTVSFSMVQNSDAGKQKHMESALQHLDKVEKQLLKAVPNKGGHRVKAIKLVRATKVQVKKGIAHADKNKDKKKDK